jgi:hypothetical protein
VIPSVGRIVHYVAYGTPGGEYPAGAHRAAVITAVGEPTYLYIGGRDQRVPRASLCILNPTGFFFTQDALQDEDTKEAGTWHWPERTE